jgi:hypothetical protein
MNIQRIFITKMVGRNIAELTNAEYNSRNRAY